MTGRARRGQSLLTTLVGGAVLFLLVATLCAVVFGHATFAATLTNQQMARDHAESAVSMALEKVLLDPAYGQAPLDEILRFQSPEQPGEGLLTFSPARATELGIPHSLNNFGQSAPADNEGRTCPAECIQLLGVGRCNGAERVVQVLLHVPTFPWVVGSSGPFQTEGECLVARVPAGQSVRGAVDPTELMPGDVGSNSDLAEAIVLSPRTVVKGDVQAVGEVVLQPGARVEGAVRPHSEPASLPRLSIADFDPRAQGQPGVQTLPPGSFSGTLSGPVVVDGDLSVNGGLVLDGGWLFVDGELDIQGGVRGKGALVVTGNSRISGQIDLQADNQVAMLVGGDVHLRGIGQASSQFRGQVYTQGNFVADSVTVVGNFIANSSDPTRGSIVLKDARALVEPQVAPIAPAAPPPRPPAPPVRERRYGFCTDPPNDMGWGAFSTAGFIYDMAGDPCAVFDPRGEVWTVYAYDPSARDFRGVVLGNLNIDRSGGSGSNYRPSWLPGVSVHDNDEIDPRDLEVTPPPAGQPAPAASAQTGFAATYQLDFNQFLAPGDRIRVLLWQEE